MNEHDADDGTILSPVVPLVKVGFQQLQDGLAESALESFEAVIVAIRKTEETGDGRGPKNRLALLLQLTCGEIMKDLARLGEASVLLEQVTARALALESTCTLRNECFGNLLINSSVALAGVHASLGQFNLAINTLMICKSLVANQAHVTNVLEARTEIAEKVNAFGEALGYKQLASRLGWDFIDSESSNDEQIVEEAWDFLDILGGSRDETFVTRYNALRRELYFGRETSLTERNLLLKEIVQLLDEWTLVASSSIQPRELRLKMLLSLAEVEIEMNATNDFDVTWQRIEPELRNLFVDAPEYVDLRRSITQYLYVLSLTIFRHEFEDDATWQRCYSITSICLFSAYELFEETRSTSPVTQASALMACSIAQLLAISNQMVERMDLVELFRSRRNIILQEVLARDPNNDRAIAMESLFKAGSDALRSEAVEGVRNWNWSVEPLV